MKEFSNSLLASELEHLWLVNTFVCMHLSSVSLMKKKNERATISNFVKFIWNNSYLYCGCSSKWRVIIAVSFNLSNWKEEAWKSQGFNEIRTRDLREYRWDALPTELWSHTLGARSVYWVHVSREEWNDMKYMYIWNNSYLNWGCRWKWRMIIAVNFPI